jgi:tryptophanyl-tRNA synthetase
MLLDDAETVQKKFKRAVTDSGTEIRFDASRPAITNLLTIYQLMTGKSPEMIESHFAGKGYAQLKEDLAEVTVEFLKPVQERVKRFDDSHLDELLGLGRDKAKAIASETIKTVKNRLGLVGA